MRIGETSGKKANCRPGEPDEHSAEDEENGEPLQNEGDGVEPREKGTAFADRGTQATAEPV